MKCPLTGKNCLKHKSYTIEDNKDGKKSTYLVCEDCMSMNPQSDKSDDINPCPRCGVTLDQVVRNSRVGCSLCYDHFGEPLAHIIAAVQFAGEAKHVGRVPESYKRSSAESLGPIRFATELAHKLAAATRQENYEEASRIKLTLDIVRALIGDCKKDDELDPQKKAELVDIVYNHLYPESA